jgi:hypothetical protein
MGVISEFFNPHRPKGVPPTLAEWLSEHPDVDALLGALDAEVKAGNAASTADHQAIVDLSAELSHRQMLLSVMVNDFAMDGRAVPADAPLYGQIATTEAALAATRKRIEATTVKTTGARAHAKAARRYITSQLVAVENPLRVTVKLPEGRLDEIITAKQRERRRLLQQRDEVLSRLPPKHITLERALAQVPVVLAPFEVHLNDRHMPYISWAREGIAAEPASVRQDEAPFATDAKAIAAWLARDEIVAEVTAQVEALYDDDTPVASDAEKRKLVAEIDAQILEAERVEAQAMWQARRDGVDLPWRADLDVRALLGVEGPVPQRRRDE